MITLICSKNWCASQYYCDLLDYEVSVPEIFVENQGKNHNADECLWGP